MPISFSEGMCISDKAPRARIEIAILRIYLRAETDPIRGGEATRLRWAPHVQIHQKQLKHRPSRPVVSTTV
eukprot:5689158-Pyramimonas_sp.AAC.1